jgi:hypothetical protein
VNAFQGNRNRRHSSFHQSERVAVLMCGLIVAAAAPAASPSAAAPAASATASNAVFPSAADSKYSKDSAGKARRETCLDQYRANKANNANGGLKWIQKGGGYYSECTKKLKGAA